MSGSSELAPPPPPEQTDDQPRATTADEHEEIETLSQDHLQDEHGVDPDVDIDDLREQFRQRNDILKRKTDKKKKQIEHLKLQKTYREALHNTRDTIALVAALIATFTFNAGINPPGGVRQDGPLIGTSIAARKTSFKVFSVCNNIALFTSLCVVLIMISIIPFKRRPLMKMLYIAHKAVWVAVSFMATAYVAAAVVMMPPPPHHGRTWDWTTAFLLAIGVGSLGSLFVCLGILMIKHQLRKRKWIRENPRIDEDGISFNEDVLSEEEDGFYAF